MFLYFIIPILYLYVSAMFGAIHEKTSDNIFWYMNKSNNKFIIILKALNITFFLPILVIVWKDRSD